MPDTPVPPPHDPYLAEFERDNLSDKDQQERTIDRTIADAFLREKIAARALAEAEKRNAALIEAMGKPAPISLEQKALDILAAIPWHVGAKMEEEILLRRLNLLGSIAIAPNLGNGIPALLPADSERWYLAEIAEELDAANLPVTIEIARQHWIDYGRRQGRRWAPNSPGWGPSAKDAPPGTQL